MRNPGDQRFSLVCAAWLLLGLVSTLSTRADLFVDPAGDDTNDCLTPVTACETVQAAIDKAADGERIELASGTYAEGISIHQRQNLTLEGHPAAQLVPPAVPAQNSLASLFLSRAITLSHLTLTGNGTADFVGGIALNESVAVAINDCVVQDLGGGGIVLFQGSTATISDSTIQRNRFHGLRIDWGSRATVNGAPFSTATSVFRDNLFAGVIINGGEAVFLGASVFDGNQIAILGEGSRLASCCGGQGLEIRSNSIGISLRGGHMELRGPVLVEDNDLIGIRLNAATASFGRFSTDRVVVRNNGAAGGEDGAGILLTGSHADLFLLDVIANAGPGVLVQDNSSIRLSDFVATANGRYGVRVESLSTARLFSPLTLRDNKGFDFSCTPNAFATGGREGVKRMSCPGFSQSPNPFPGGPIMP